MLKIFKKAPSPEQPTPLWRRSLSPDGILITKASNVGELIDYPLFDGLLTQLHDESLLVDSENECFLSWDCFYAAEHLGIADLTQVFSLPSLSEATPKLLSDGSLTDKNFSIGINGWVSVNHGAQNGELVGPILIIKGHKSLLSESQWKLVSEIRKFARRSPEERNELYHRQSWAKIRECAVACHGVLDAFLHSTVILRPETLEISLRKSQNVKDDAVVEVIPGFAGAPRRWLERFDLNAEILDRYDVSTDDGIVQVLISPKVKSVLREIKKFPGRIVAGSRAQAFLVNPFSTLGDDAKDVLIEEQFEQARDEAGINFDRFTPLVRRSLSGQIDEVLLIVDSVYLDGSAESEEILLDGSNLESFIRKAEHALARDFSLLAWDGYDFEVDAECRQKVDLLKNALQELSTPQVKIAYDQIYDLSHYSSRVEGIGVDKPVFSPYIAKKNDGAGWFPENASPIISYTSPDTGEVVDFPVDKETIEVLGAKIQEAQRDGKSMVYLSGLPAGIPVDQARSLERTFKEVWSDLGAGSFTPPSEKTHKNGEAGPKARKTLILRSNIETVGYDERRELALNSCQLDPQIPKSINAKFTLLDHQKSGLAWLQHLFKLQTKFSVRGGILADDMGLGKTFQLLGLIAWAIESNPDLDPVLIVAPLSLLENWKDESEKFFPGAFKIVTAYGDGLSSLRLKREEIDERLRTEDGLVRFLKPNWVGSAKVVLTTYETLRDLEFSFASQRWSIMICDEAQKIKNPAAMVTRAAKKQNAGFKIACTGTPVENTLVDLWSLFDFVQPGLLGALNDFGANYRRPIEIEEGDDIAQERLGQLKRLIEPQMLRRTKADVADLPPKIIDENCRNLPLSNVQRALYAKAIDDFKKRNEPGAITPFKNHLGLLQYIRLVCTDPKRYGLTVFKPEPIAEYRLASPKLDWLIETLRAIRKNAHDGEKAIIFCEFRSIQRLLQHYISETFGYDADIINGDTNASSGHINSRQKRIRAFQDEPGFGVIILSPVAVGFGVNIQKANHVIHYMRTWNPAKEDQATDRAYRIGQDKSVYVYYPGVRSKDFVTFDEKLDRLLEAKRSLAGDILNGSPDISPGEFRIDEMSPEESAGGFDQKVTIDVALQMDWRMFEGLVAALWARKGYQQVYCTPASRDYGVDVVAINGDSGVLIQTKTSGSEGYKHSWDAVKELTGGLAFYKRRHPQVKFELLAITNQQFNSRAYESAALCSVTLLNQSDLADLVQAYPVDLDDVERMLYTASYDS
ncbi:MAG: SNF2-related protein [Fluviibacter phosphoraccumulans]